MRYFNEDKTIELQESEINYELGTVVEDVLIIHHDEIPAVEGIEEQGHYETIQEYPNGGKDVEWIIDVPGVEASPKIEAYDEEEKIYVYKPYPKKLLKEKELSLKLNNLKYELSETDYKLLKFMEGWYTEEEYKPIKEYRESLREKIRELEKELAEHEN